MADEDNVTNDFNRANRGGRVGILVVVQHIARSHSLKIGHIPILTDNKQALAQGACLQKRDGPFKYLADDYDLKCWAKNLEQILLKNQGNAQLSVQ